MGEITTRRAVFELLEVLENRPQPKVETISAASADTIRNLFIISWLQDYKLSELSLPGLAPFCRTTDIQIPLRINEERPTPRALFKSCQLMVRLKHKACLNLKHPRRVDVSECRNGSGRRTYANELSKSRCRCIGVAVYRDAATEEVAVIEDIESLES